MKNPRIPPRQLSFDFYEHFLGIESVSATLCREVAALADRAKLQQSPLSKAQVVALDDFRSARTQDQNAKLYSNIFESIKHIG